MILLLVMASQLKDLKILPMKIEQNLKLRLLLKP